ncbi:MAG: ADP-forming succinate--CoA ligase subunit beta [Candidatus Omnitrophica bacterium]|nr:ADP-forming succinate--CoA ligase subunit beta [Candidatus Omnitrophota bacterium]
MKLHEYQAKQLFASVGIAIPRAILVKDRSEAVAAYETLRRQCSGQEGWVCTVKAQLHAGGRGKAGGVLNVASAKEVEEIARGLLGKHLVTHQTGPQGLSVSALLLEEKLSSRQELYLALTVDRFRAEPVFLASRQGGMDIETVAAKTPQEILRESFDIEQGPSHQTLERLAAHLGLEGSWQRVFEPMAQSFWNLMKSTDASLAEINPLVVTEDSLCALDAKLTLDDNALFRHPDLAKLRDESQEDPLELRASRIGISYVGLSGTIGCLVNGAGLAMATNDIIKLSGGEPANFLDVGGGANVEQVTNAFSIILSDPRVKVIFVNIFGGIMRCDWIAQGLLNATEKLEVRIPIVVRLEGTNVEEGRRLLTTAKHLSIVSIEGLAIAARKAVELAKRTQS